MDLWWYFVGLFFTVLAPGLLYSFVAILVVVIAIGLLEEFRRPHGAQRTSSTHEGVTTPMASSLFAQSSEDDEGRTTKFIHVIAPEPKLDMPRSMYEGYDRPVAVSPALRRDIERLIELLEAMP